MKALANGAPELQRVHIESRSARKHYGANSDIDFVEHVHNKSKRYSYCCPLATKFINLNSEIQVLGYFLWLL